MRTDGIWSLMTLRLPASVALTFLLCGCGHMNGYMMNQTGTQHFQRGNYTAARDNFQRAVVDNPYNADYIHNLATAMKKQGEVVGAEKAYYQALNLNPSHQPSYHSLAMLYKEQGRQAQAANLLRGWADTQPYVAESHIEMAWLQRESGDISGSEQSLQKALRVEPGNHVAMAHLGELYQKTGQPDRALAMYQRSLHTNWFQPQVQSRVAALGRSPSAIAARPVHVSAAPTMAAYSPYPQAASTTAPYGVSQRVALAHPLPAYDMSGTTFSAAPPGVFASPVIQTAPQVVNADPAHVPQLSASLPEVQAH